jgi:hypothetical protein
VHDPEVPFQSDGESGGANCVYVLANPCGTPQPPQNQTPGIVNPITAANNAFNNCVQNGALSAMGKGVVTSIWDRKTTTTDLLVNAGQAALDLQNDCLAANPLADLSPNYNGIPLMGEQGNTPVWIWF